MAGSTTLVTLDEYLATTYKPSCDYLDGVLRPKPMPTWNHSMIQTQIAQLINLNFPHYRAGSEVTVRVTSTQYLVPDIAVQDAAKIQQPYPTEPVHLCVEVLSPNDRMSEAIAKCEEYHAWGVPHVWIVDPEERRAWEFPRNQRLHEIREGGKLTASEILIGLEDVFSVIS